MDRIFQSISNISSPRLLLFTLKQSKVYMFLREALASRPPETKNRSNGHGQRLWAQKFSCCRSHTSAAAFALDTIVALQNSQYLEQVLRCDGMLGNRIYRVLC